jgi:hypothetical protein
MTGASACGSSTGLSSGKKSILSAAASFAAVRNEKFDNVIEPHSSQTLPHYLYLTIQERKYN